MNRWNDYTIICVILHYLGAKYSNGTLNSSISDLSQIPKYYVHDVFQPLPREDCDKWNYWNSLMFSFTAITTIGMKCVYKVYANTFTFFCSLTSHSLYCFYRINIKAMGTYFHELTTEKLLAYFILSLVYQLMEY